MSQTHWEADKMLDAFQAEGKVSSDSVEMPPEGWLGGAYSYTHGFAPESVDGRVAFKYFNPSNRNNDGFIMWKLKHLLRLQVVILGKNRKRRTDTKLFLSSGSFSTFTGVTIRFVIQIFQVRSSISTSSNRKNFIFKLQLWIFQGRRCSASQSALSWLRLHIVSERIYDGREVLAIPESYKYLEIGL
ncbi:hypothetical protein L6452_08537 [Arctium lappa]|uniref:Uncharacterized protein n=1 Tax=Arctium lappa TaxID=4217 RepID=A0ACB9DHV7_ARCLA|nr:hypothetical protein L6452_08537 [Arctium lappa]